MNSADEGTLTEFQELALSAGVQLLKTFQLRATTPSAKYFIGLGKAEEIAEAVAFLETDVVLVNHELSPAQQRNLEDLFKCRVVGRSALILDIFAQRARSFEGRLQVELAQLEHLSSRLVHARTYLKRQKGGIGLRGPGETQLESDRRLLGLRIKLIKKELEHVLKQREQRRRARRRAELPTISLVGYTNAGKSTVFNRLTEAQVYAADQVFATLDPTLRHLFLPKAGKVIVADTVGFIRDLQHELIEAFKATLEETQLADLLLHVVDCSRDNRTETQNEVNKVLASIGASEIPQLLVYNKIDLREEALLPRIDRNAEGKPWRVWLSATTGEGFELLTQALSELMSDNLIRIQKVLQPDQAKLRAKLYELKCVQHETLNEEGAWVLDLELSKEDSQRLF